MAERPQKRPPMTVEPEGVLIVNKHGGATSHDIVGNVRYIYRTKKVGHTGTLDPMAEGVLVVLIGRAAKAAEYLVADRKTYRATLRLGLTTDTEDVTGTVLTTSNALPTPEDVDRIIRERFIGRIKQIPPMYSALKVGGQKLCDLARRGVTVEREAREIEIFSFKCSPVVGVPSDYDLTVTCSSGTYIRTLCSDIGAALGCGGVMATLTRLEAGGYRIEDAVTVDALREDSDEALLRRLLPTESLFASLPTVSFPPFYERLIRNGCAVSEKKLRLTHAVGDRLRLLDGNGDFFGLGEVVNEDGEPSVKCIKFFKL